MMKATAWFCPLLLTLLSATRLVCTAQRGVAVGGGGAGGAAGVAGAAVGGGVGYANGYPLDYLDAQVIQDEYSTLAKRNKPSLSIVNPLDVLRQRLLLEIARRQMKENTRQVELNRAILKNVGKRVFLEPVNGPWASSRYQERQQEQQQQREQLERQQAALREQLRREQLQQQHFPSQLWSIGWPQTTGSQSYAPSSSSSSSSSALSTSSTGSSRFFDFLQRPEAQARHQQQRQQERQQQETAGGQQLLDDASKSLGLNLGVADVAKHQQSQSQSNGNEIANETNHENGSRKSQLQLQSAIGKSATGDEDEDNVDDDAKDQEDMLDELYYHWATEQPDELEEQNNANGRLPWRLFYRMHKNSHYAN